MRHWSLKISNFPPNLKHKIDLGKKYSNLPPCLQSLLTSPWRSLWLPSTWNYHPLRTSVLGTFCFVLFLYVLVKTLDGDWLGGDVDLWIQNRNALQDQNLHMQQERTTVMLTLPNCSQCVREQGSQSASCVPMMDSLFQPHNVGIVNNPILQAEKLRHWQVKEVVMNCIAAPEKSYVEVLSTQYLRMWSY